MISRLLIVAVTAAIGGGVALGRKSINRQIENKMPTAIEAAQVLAQAELDKQIKQVISERLFAFTVNLFVKAALVGGVYLLFDLGHLSAQGLKIVIGFLVGVFLFRDALKTLPYFAPAMKHIRQNNWNLRRALTEFIAGVAFERAYAEAMITMETGPNRLLLALSNYTAHSISNEVGEAVREVARSTSFDIVKWRFLIAVVFTAVMSGAYAAFVLLTVGTI